MSAEYFVRYAVSREYLENDAKRGYSFHGYQFAVSAEELLEEYYPERLEDEDVEDLIEDLNIRETSDGLYGFALDGLCGFGEFVSIEDAESSIGIGSRYGDCAGIFSGHQVGGDPGEGGPLFCPVELIKVI